jgi:hypothetical protein
MRTNIEIDDKLMAKAMKLSHLKTKKAVVEAALQTLVRTRAQEGIWKYFGKVEFWDGYDHKAMRGDTPEELRPARTKLKTRAAQRAGRPAKGRAA